MSSTPEVRSLPDPPTDGITSLSYLQNPSNTHLLSSTSWDGSLRIHDTKAMTHVLTRTMESGPLLSSATPEGGDVFTGGLDGSIRKLDIPTNTTSIIGRHTEQNAQLGQNACSCLAPIPSHPSLIASASWDSRLHIWDVRSSSKASSFVLPGKAFSMDSHGSRVVIATAGRRMVLVDVRMMEGEEEDKEVVELEEKMNRESSLKYQTRVVRFFPDGGGMALGSIEGRVAVEYLEDGGEAKKKKYAFKCHRVNDIVYPVNSISFHPQFGTFATGGCDGTVVVWDGTNKKRLTSLPKFATSIASLAFHGDGKELAIASSYSFEEGERDHPRDEIFVREMLDSECRPKMK